MIINHNMPALNTHRQMGANQTQSSKNMEKLSSGLRINRAGDDAAGLSISEKMRGQIRGLNQATRNSQDGISLIQTAEGALNETHSILQRMRELSVQSANGTNTSLDREALQNEIKELKGEVDRIGNTTEFNTMKLLNGELNAAGGVSVGQNSTVGSVVDKQTSGKLGGGSAITAAADADFKEETLTIDGTDIKVDWSSLTQDEKNVLKAVGSGLGTNNTKAAELLQNKINEAIDNSGANVAHVKVYMSGNNLTVESGSTGIESKITSTGLLNTMAGTTNVEGTSKYNGTTVDANKTFEMELNGVTMKVTIGEEIKGGETTMASAAKIMEDALNAAISAYNGVSGKSQGEEGYLEDVVVKATNDGRFQINSESGPVNLADTIGNTFVTDLGLSDAQTNSNSGGGMTMQVGANKGQTISFGIGDMRSAALGISGVDISKASTAQNAIESVDKAINKVSAQRSKLGAVQNRLEHTINNLGTTAENLTASESRIRDVDMAKEMMELTKNNILQQAAQAMLAQANQAPQQVLQLLR